MAKTWVDNAAPWGRGTPKTDRTGRTHVTVARKRRDGSWHLALVPNATAHLYRNTSWTIPATPTAQ